MWTWIVSKSCFVGSLSEVQEWSTFPWKILGIVLIKRKKFPVESWLKIWTIVVKFRRRVTIWSSRFLRKTWQLFSYFNENKSLKRCKFSYNRVSRKNERRKKRMPIPSPLGFTKKINSKIKVISRLIALTPMQSTFRLHSAKKLYFEGSL